MGGDEFDCDGLVDLVAPSNRALSLSCALMPDDAVGGGEGLYVLSLLVVPGRLLW